MNMKDTYQETIYALQGLSTLLVMIAADTPTDYPLLRRVNASLDNLRREIAPALHALDNKVVLEAAERFDTGKYTPIPPLGAKNEKAN